MNSYYLEWQSRRRKVRLTVRQEGAGLKPTDSRISFNSLGRKSRQPLSKSVWNRNHPVDDSPGKLNTTPYSSRASTNLRCPHTTASGRQSSYEIELLNRRLNILGDGFLHSGGDPWTPIEVTVTPASSDFLAPELSDDSSVEVPVTPGRRQFVSLRGLPGLGCIQNKFAGKTRTESEEKTCEEGKQGEFFVTAETEKAVSSTSNKGKMTHPEDRESQNHIVPSPWADGSQEATSHDKSTSPFQDGGEEPMTTQIRVLQNEGKHAHFRQAPLYPFETGILPTSNKLNRPTIHNGLLRSHRLHDYTQPSVVSSTQQLLCLTPSRGGVITLGSSDDVKDIIKPTESNRAIVQVKRFNETDNRALPISTTVVTKTSGGEKNTSFRLMQRDGSSRPRTSTAHGHPFALNNPHYKHVTQIRKPYRYPALSPAISPARKSEVNPSKTPTFERNATAMSMIKHPPSTAYRIIESHLKWNRRLPVFQDEVANVYPYQPSFSIQNPTTQGRKMAPVLRVVPAFPKTPKPAATKKPPKSPVETEPASQKKVRFSDQMGLPLVRNATPNYRRKHSYILRWLETAGRPAKSIPLA